MTTNTLDYFFAPTRSKTDAEHTKHFAVGNDSLLGRISATTNCFGMTPAEAMADQPGMIAHGGFGQPGLGCKVDENTQLRWGIPGAWREKGKHQLWSRPFATTPDLGGGNPNEADIESNLIHSTLVRNRKEASTIMDKGIPNFFQPLIPVKKAEYTNVNNWVEQGVRGGDATRLISVKYV